MGDEEEEIPQPVWEGQFDEEGLPHGPGTMKYPPPPVNEEEEEEEKPGDSFEGNFEHGKRHGKGKYTWGVTGAVYEGDYVENKKVGQGKISYPNKSFYEGSWADDKMEGEGIYVYGNGDMYLGGFLAGKRHGKGSYHFKEMVCQLAGDWVEGGFVSGRWIMKDGSMFYGTFHKQVAPAEGAYYFNTSRWCQKGKFLDDGKWIADAEPMFSKVEKLDELVVPPPAPPAAPPAAEAPAAPAEEGLPETA